MEKLAKIDGEEIVIRFPIAALTGVVPYALERAWGARNIAVVDKVAFAEELVVELNREEENGDTPVHRMIDNAVVRAADNGVEGLSYS